MTSCGPSVADEETPLLNVSATQKGLPTPLPKLQLGIVFVLLVCEPIASSSVYPYITQLISSLDMTGGDQRKVGYYAGLIESLFFVTEAMTVLQWSRASDVIGRKPILLSGLLGLTLSTLFFGLSRTFWTLVMSRCLCGLLNGNIGVMKSVMGEITDSTNRAKGLTLMPVVWAAGVTIGPLIGGTLARPYEHFPTLFMGVFWKKFPYFLPCAVTASFSFTAFIITLLFLKETAPKKTIRRIRPTLECPEFTSASASRPVLLSEAVPLREILVYPVVLSVSNYAVLAFLSICLNVLLPLFFAMPITIGGLGLSPVRIGYIMGMYGVVSGAFQAMFFTKAIHTFGERCIFITSILTSIPIFLLFPAISLLAKKDGLTLVVWLMVSTMFILMPIMDMGFGSIFMYITASAPSKHSLGATNGLAQTTVSIARAVGPAMATSLFSFSVEQNVLSGYGVYAVMIAASLASIFLAVRLPPDVWQECEGN